jgi:hypothetical protein
VAGGSRNVYSRKQYLVRILQGKGLVLPNESWIAPQKYHSYYNCRLGSILARHTGKAQS